ncbi:hypothetical protein G9A89_014407 [Geosiphon pyriformis]|nr:hypothetical protein G9A89_014407 [Geosiphon pyriformis]
MTFIFELGLIKATKKTTNVKIMVNTDLKKFTGCSDWAVVLKEILIGTFIKAVCTALSEFRAIVLIKMQLVELWQKAARCAAICFDSTELLDAVLRAMPVLRGANLHWSHLVLVKCSKYENLGYTSLDCAVGGKFLSGTSPHRAFSKTDKSRLVTIYAKHLASVV